LGAVLTLALIGRSAAAQVKNFRLLDEAGRSRELFAYGDKKAVVLVVQGNGCPIFQKSAPNIISLRDRFAPRGVAFLLINANPQDTPQAVAAEAAFYGLDIPVLIDDSQAVVKSLSIMRTAEALVIDPRTWKIVYRGAIDDGLHYGAQRPVTRRYVMDALDAVLKGKNPPVKRTEAFGCLIQFKKPRR
jgi:peroxiredoxin